MEAIEFHVAGVKFHKFHTVKSLLEVGMTLNLEREPHNRYDIDPVSKVSNAVKITHNGVMLGYVPTKDKKNPGVLLSKDVSEALYEGTELKATIIELEPEFEPWLALKVRIEDDNDEDLLGNGYLDGPDPNEEGDN